MLPCRAPCGALQAVKNAAATLGPVGGPLVFIAVYALFTVLLVPGSVLTLAAGALFGGCAWRMCCRACTANQRTCTRPTHSLSRWSVSADCAPSSHAATVNCLGAAGTLEGTAVVSVGSTLGAVLAFLVSAWARLRLAL